MRSLALCAVHHYICARDIITCYNLDIHLHSSTAPIESSFRTHFHFQFKLFIIFHIDYWRLQKIDINICLRTMQVDLTHLSSSVFEHRRVDHPKISV